jgi:hypothetical protein
MAEQQTASARQRAENAPDFSPRTPPRIDDATDVHTLTHQN